MKHIINPDSKFNFVCKKLNPCFGWMSKFPVFKGIEEGISSIGLFVLATSLIVVFVNIPNLLGVHYSSNLQNQINKIWILSMGLVALFLSGTTAKGMCEILNNKLALNRQIDCWTMMMGSMTCYLLIVVTKFSGNSVSIDLSQFGGMGILLALIVGILSSYIVYPFFRYFNVKLNTTIPGSFFYKLRMLGGLITSFLIAALIGWIVNSYLFTPLNNLLDDNFSHYIRDNADQWWGLAIIYVGYAISWFCGIHGPSALSFLANPINTANDYANQQIFINHLSSHYHIMTWGSDNFIGCFGGTGATFVLPIILLLCVKSKELKKVGKASMVSTIFGANEPVLFGAPVIFNPYFLVPIIFAPIANAFLLKIFVDYWGMRGFVTPLNWTIPGPVGIFIGTAFDLKSLLLIVCVLACDFLLYYPFVKLYDRKISKLALAKVDVFADEPALSSPPNKPGDLPSETLTVASQLTKEITLLIICAGGATSGVLAQKIKSVADERGIKFASSGSAWGSHKDLLKKADIVFLAPQVATNLDLIEQQLKSMEHNIKVIALSGKDYFNMVGNPEIGLDLAIKNIT